MAGWLTELVWEHRLQSLADHTPLWFDNMMLLCSLVLMAWLFVRYLRKDEAEAMLADAFGRPAVVAQARVRPWRNNFAMLARA